MITPTSSTVSRRVSALPLVLRQLYLPARGLSPAQRLLKRVIDLLLSSVCFALALPMLVLIAVAIKLESPGPILVRQRRVGEGGRLFNLYRFRTTSLESEVMHASSTQPSRHRHNLLMVRGASQTRVGALLGAASLDALPQLINILRGDLSLVGPRPELPQAVEQYHSWQRARLLVPQGLTGWWQVNGRTSYSVEDDLYYVEHYSIWLDLKIILMTLAVLLGFDESV